jgi:5-methyltetrahydrofolate--homocysteine methyltransferase
MRLLGAERIGLELTETFAMLPAAAVSGVYLHHPQSKYFAVGRIGTDQVADYADRKELPLGQVERYLSPNLS